MKWNVNLITGGTVLIKDVLIIRVKVFILVIANILNLCDMVNRNEFKH
ncbi:hypothetical protein [Yersinia phage vB_YenM_P8]